MRWDLSKLYSSFTCDEFNNDMLTLSQLIKDLDIWLLENTTNHNDIINKIEYFINSRSNIGLIYQRLNSFSELSLSVDSKNITALNAIEKLESIIPTLKKVEVNFQTWLSSVNNIETYINKSKILSEHKFFLHEVIDNSKYLLDEKSEIIISELKNSGSNAWSKLQESLSSSLLVDITMDDHIHQKPLSVVRNMAYNADPKIRKTAYYAELDSYKKIDESSAACLNSIKKEVITISHLRGYKNPLDMTLKNSRMDYNILSTMLECINEYLPVFHKYYKHKAKLLGYDNCLPFYDFFAPLGDAHITFTIDEAKDYIIKNFGTFSKPLSDFAKKAFDENWIDSEPREGKRGGAFCDNLHVVGESRILANFSGSLNDVVTLAHELGHGYHGECLANEKYLNSDYPMPIAETASTFCETIILKAALNDANDDEKLAILENDLMGISQIIVDIYSRYLFETKLFEMRKDGSLSVEQLKNIMIDSQKKAYGSSIDPNYMHPYMWVCKPHYYYADYNYYNFPYAFGLLFAKGLYAKYLEDGEAFIKTYDDLLAASGKNSLYDLAKLVNIDLHDKEFWRKSLSIIKEDIELFCKKNF